MKRSRIRGPSSSRVRTDPEVPPLPPHITFEQAKNYMTTLVKGDPNEGHMIRDSARQVLASILPGGKG